MELHFTAHAAQRMAERNIRREWIELTINSPDRVEPDPIDTVCVHALKRIDEFGSRVLRVVYNPAISPPRIISVHFDRRLKGML